jgi:glycosyltransferase involved in cell wall biosynthesis
VNRTTGAAQPRFSVVICVYTEQRWDDIMAAIASVRAQSLPAHELIVVVDHNDGLLSRLVDGLPPVYDGPPVVIVANHYQRGLSGGKNTGVSYATGDVVAFLDDDAFAEPEWLKYFADCYGAPAIVGVGGLTLPNWDSARPSWFPREFDWVLGCNYLGLASGRQRVRNLLGGNASFRREVFDQVGGFTSDAGRSVQAGRPAARLPLGCEETEFCIKIGQQLPDSRLIIDDRAVIWHRVPDQRARLRYFVTRCYAEGLSKAVVTRRVGSADGLAAERRHAFATLPAGLARCLRESARGDLAGIGRAGAIIAGLSATTAGYLAGRLTGR